MRLYVARADAKTGQILKHVRDLPGGTLEFVVVGRVDGKSRGIGSPRHLQPDSLERGYDPVDFVPLLDLLNRQNVSVARQLPEPLPGLVARHGISLKIDGRGGHYVPARLLDTPVAGGDADEDAIEPDTASVPQWGEWARRTSSEIAEMKRKIDVIALALDITTKPTVNGVDTTDSLFDTTDDFLSARG